MVVKVYIVASRDRKNDNILHGISLRVFLNKEKAKRYAEYENKGIPEWNHEVFTRNLHILEFKKPYYER